MRQDNYLQNQGQIGGISLASFLQMLEQERKSCTLIVRSGDKIGELYFDQGVLTDAQYEHQVGVEAVITLLSWEDSTFLMTQPDDRLRRVTSPLAQILLEAATRQDEKNAGSKDLGRGSEYKSDRSLNDTSGGNPGIRKMVETIVAIAGVKHYFIMNRKGVMIAQSSRNRSIGDFIRYCIVSGSRLRKELDVRGPHQIRLFMENGEKLLVVPGNGIIVALLVGGQQSVSEVTERLSKVLVG